ncbi:hypothetical protein M513_07653 [Trichuris suis]|uniref:Uncharacterized protein n=1 Tax=Trichuris suis TaxID=68888 RepID=A0A085M2J4_9BILA|nr:hypothetical protein M513_07653 [Trichuris suis]
MIGILGRAPSHVAGLRNEPRDPLECTPFKLFTAFLYHVKDFMCSLYLCAKVFPVSANRRIKVKEPKEIGHNS